MTTKNPCMTKKYVIPGTCKVCGYVPGCVNKKLTKTEHDALVKAGYDVTVNVHGDDIAASPNKPKWYNDARFMYHSAGHPRA